MRRWLLCGLLLLPLLAQAAGVRIAAFVPDALVYQGVAMVPLRPAAEVLGGTLSVGSEGRVVVRRGTASYLYLPRERAQYNGAGVRLASLVQPFNHADVTYVPLRALAEALGYQYVTYPQEGVAVATLPGTTTKVRFPLLPQEGDPKQYRDGDLELFQVNLDGSGLKRLTYDVGDNCLPAFSPDGTTLAYSRNFWFYRRTLASSEETCLWAGLYTDEKWCHPSDPMFIAQGKQLLYNRVYDGSEVSSADTEITIVNTDGTGQRVLTHGVLSALHPQGTRLLFTRSNGEGTAEIYQMDLDGKNVKLITKGETPRYTRQGTALSFHRTKWNREECITLHEIYRCALKDGVAEAPVKVATEVVTPEVHPDGEQIVYVGASTAPGIYLQRPAGAPLRLTREKADCSPHFSPDGRQIIFLRGDDLMLMAADGTKPRRLCPGILLPFDTVAFTPDGQSVIIQAFPNPDDNAD